MNKITAAINWLDQAFAPLGEMMKEDQFRAEMLASIGMKEKDNPADKAKTKAKLNALLEFLNEMRKKLGLDKSDIPKVNNLASAALFFQEFLMMLSILKEMLDTCEVAGPRPGEASAEEKEMAIENGVRAIAKFFTVAYFKKSSPRVAAVFDMLGIFADEINETKRALYQLFYWDKLSPVGDFKEDSPLRITKAAFLWPSVLLTFLDKFPGTFLLNMGTDLSPEKDRFPIAARLAQRVLQIQFLPGEIIPPAPNEYEYQHEFRKPNSTDAFLSFVSIPVMPAGANENSKPDGFRYALNLELNAGDFGTELGKLRLRFLNKVSGGFSFGHGSGFKVFGTGVVDNPTPLIEIYLKGQPDDPGKSDEVRSGDIFFRIHPKKKRIKNTDELDAEFSLELHDFSYSISGEGRDGFMQKILPEKSGSQIKVSLKIVYSPLENKWTLTGLDGNEGFLFRFNVGAAFFKQVQIPTLYMGIKPFIEKEEVHGGELELSALLKLELGPFQLTVDRLGVAISLDFKKRNANLGFTHVAADLKPPTAVGFLVKAPMISGGGILGFDPDKHQYFGAGELSIQVSPDLKLTLKIVAIILTRMPDGKPGFSFLLIASVEFNPAFEIGLGFKLNGLGVLVAINRSMNTEEFRVAVRDDRLNAVLFPDNPVGNISTIVQSINSLFPVAQNRYVFGIMARLSWGSSNLVDIKLGLLIEVPSPVKIALIGVIRVLIKPDTPVLRLQVNFIVLLDLGNDMLSIDAALFESRLLKFSLTGDLILRYRWGDDPIFLAAVGGFHPDFNIPGGLGLPVPINRLAISLMENDNIKLTVSCYLAVTSNTVQAGFAIDFKLDWSKFHIEAGLSVDALFHFDPFYFAVDFEGKLHIYWGSRHLAGVSVRGQFSGTNPWRIKGTATFSIWIWDYDVDFDKSTGEELTENIQEVEVLPLLENAISDANNWQAIMPAKRQAQVVLRNTKDDLKDKPAAADSPAPLLADPLSKVDVIQQVVPLGIRIDKVGSQKVKGPRTFDVVPVEIVNDGVEKNPLDDHFAPAMFIEMEDAQRLSRKSYEKMKAGLSFSDTETLLAGAGQISECDYDIKFKDPLAPKEKAPVNQITRVDFLRWAGNNAIAKSEQGRKLRAVKVSELRKKASKGETFVLIDPATGTKVAEVAGQKSMSAAYYEKWKLQKANPKLKTNVVRESELI
jgi:hypothetical protein